MKKRLLTYIPLGLQVSYKKKKKKNKLINKLQKYKSAN